MLPATIDSDGVTIRVHIPPLPACTGECATQLGGTGVELLVPALVALAVLAVGALLFARARRRGPRPSEAAGAHPDAG